MHRLQDVLPGLLRRRDPWDAEAKRPIVAYPEDCVHCNFCEISCKDEAITIVADWDLPYPPVIERGFPYTVGGPR